MLFGSGSDAVGMTVAWGQPARAKAVPVGCGADTLVQCCLIKMITIMIDLIKTRVREYTNR